MVQGNEAAETPDVSKKVFPLVKAGDLKELQHLWDDGVPVDVRGGNTGDTPLMFAAALIEAAKFGRAKTVKLLVESGADIGVQGELGWDAFLKAVASGWITIVRYLISQGCNLQVVDEQGRNAYMVATQMRQPHVAELLVKKGLTPVEAEKGSEGRVE